MTKIKMCGLSRQCDIDYANQLMPEYIGFVFVENSKRYVSPKKALELRNNLNSKIISVGVFVDADINFISEIAKQKTIDMVQLHGSENDEYIRNLRKLISIPIIQAFTIKTKEDINKAKKSSAEYILFDSGKGSGKTFNHSLIKDINRDYFLAGGITIENIKQVTEKFKPYAIDASSSLETNGYKDFYKMRAFADALRRKDLI